MFIISELQQQCLWEKVIIAWQATQSHSEFNSSFFLAMDPWQLAAKAKEAWYILNNNQIPLLEVQKYFGCKEAQIFLEWVNNYQLACQQLNYTEQLKLTPNNLEALLGHSEQTKFVHNCFKFKAQDFIEEITKAAQWSADPNVLGNIGIVIFDLEQKHSQIDYVFSNFLEKDFYNIVLAIKLYEYPLIDIAFLILKLSYCYVFNINIKYEDFSKLLRTRFIDGGIDQIGFRSNLDYLLREELDYEFNWQYLIKRLKKIQIKNYKNGCTNNFLELCEKFIQTLAESNLNINSKKDCQYWVEFCQKILQVFSWGRENISNKEQQLIDHWNALLDQYVELTNFLKEHDLLTFITILTKLAKEDPVKFSNFNRVFTKNITILDLSTAMSLKFDNLWICGLSDVNWPKAYEFNPFLPIELQKKFCLPDQNTEEIIIYSQLLQKLINNTSKLVICSYPLYVDDHLVRCSSIINDFPDFSDPFTTTLLQNETKDLTLETYIDDQAPHYDSNHFSGITFLKLQAACPFKANAKVRLKANKLSQPLSYLSKKLKGEILHNILATFWNKYKNLAELKELSEIKLKEELISITVKILKKLQKYKPVSLNHAMLQIESVLLVNQCFNFIKQYDLTRDDFIVLHIEEKLIVKLQDLLITIKVDRIDQLSDSSLVVIDYKTGRQLINKWDNIRMDDPQLPIYSLYSSKIKGLITALIRSEQLKFTGVVAQNIKDLLFKEFDLLNIKLTELNNWQDHLSVWYNNLYALANDFKSGVAIVDPKYGATTCRGCDLKYMCREYR